MVIKAEEFVSRRISPDEAVRKIKRGGRIFVGSGGASPDQLIAALTKNSFIFSDNEILHLLTLGKADYTKKEYARSFRHNAFFIGTNVRESVKNGFADYTPIFLSEIPLLFRKGSIPIDTALIMVSPPDVFGFCSLGINVDIVKEASKQARILIAEINPNMPVTMGDSYIHISEIDYYVKSELPLKEHKLPETDDVSRRIGKYVANLINDGATLQMGIGSIPDAVLKYITEKNDLGIHTEMFSDGVIELILKGVITNRKKGFHDGKVITSFCLGTKDLYQFVDRNPAIEFHPSDYVNDPFNIARNNSMIAINSALEVDLTGQVCADSIGTTFYSGIGGQVDFVRGAARSRGGKPVIALPSTAKGGKLSRIVPQLSLGAGVVTTRGDVHYVVTEYGIAYLHGKSIRQRALELVQIAHPDFRNELLNSLRSKRYIFTDQKDFKNLKDFNVEKYEFRLSIKNRAGNKMRVDFRPIMPSDETLLQNFFYSHTIETIYNRYFHMEKSMDHKRAQELVNVNLKQDMALVGLYGVQEGQQIIAVGRYDLNPTNNSAEVAFVIHEDFQGSGIGTQLLNQLIEIGRDRGVTEFTAHVLTSNVKMLHLFQKIAPEYRRKIEDNVVEISFQLKNAPKKFCYLPQTKN